MPGTCHSKRSLIKKGVYKADNLKLPGFILPGSFLYSHGMVSVSSAANDTHLDRLAYRLCAICSR
jgi:hypothetical protein